MEIVFVEANSRIGLQVRAMLANLGASASTGGAALYKGQFTLRADTLVCARIHACVLIITEAMTTFTLARTHARMRAWCKGKGKGRILI